MIDAGITATTAMHGANAPVDKTDWSPLAGKAVLIWPDRDKPGFGYAEAASQAVLMAGATSCAILLPPDDKPEGWDAFDALAEGFDVTGFIATGPRLAVQSLDDERDPFGDAGVAGDADSQTACDSDATEEVRKHAGVDAAHAYGGFMAHLTAWCEHHQIPYQGVPVGTIKKHATGKGNAGKAEMIAAAWHKQGIVVVPLDEIYDEWDRAFLSGIATKLYGARTTASCKSTPWAEGEVIDRGDGLPVGTSPGQMMIEKNAGAARAVRDALEAVGGSTSPAGLALWYVAGLGKSVREWALRQGWAGKAISLHEAKGILIAGLGVLARYYGHDRSGSARSRHPQRNSAVP